EKLQFGIAAHLPYRIFECQRHVRDSLACEKRGFGPLWPQRCGRNPLFRFAWVVVRSPTGNAMFWQNRLKKNSKKASKRWEAGKKLVRALTWPWPGSRSRETRAIGPEVSRAQLLALDVVLDPGDGDTAVDEPDRNMPARGGEGGRGGRPTWRKSNIRLSPASRSVSHGRLLPGHAADSRQL